MFLNMAPASCLFVEVIVFAGDLDCFLLRNSLKRSACCFICGLICFFSSDILRDIKLVFVSMSRFNTPVGLVLIVLVYYVYKAARSGAGRLF